MSINDTVSVSVTISEGDVILGLARALGARPPEGGAVGSCTIADPGAVYEGVSGTFSAATTGETVTSVDFYWSDDDGETWNELGTDSSGTTSWSVDGAITSSGSVTIRARAYAGAEVVATGTRVVTVSLPYTLTTTAGAIAGPFATSAAYLSAPQGTGPDFATLGVAVGIDFWNEGSNATDKCLYGVCRSGRGWWLDRSSTYALSFMTPGGTPTNRSLTTGMVALRDGHNRVWLARMANGEVWRSINGFPAAKITDPTAIIAIDTTCDHWIGRVSAGVLAGGYPDVKDGVMSIVHIAAAVTAQNLTDWSDVANGVDRFAQHAEVQNHANLSSWLDIARDWDGVSSTIVAGAGSNPLTFTVHGSVPHTRIGREKRIPVAAALLHNNTDFSTVGSGATEHFEHSAAPEMVLTTDAARVAVDAYSTFTTLAQNWAQFGVDDGTTHQPCMATRYGTREVVDSLALAAGTKIVRITSGVRSRPSSTILADWMQAIRVPEGATVSLVRPSASGRILVCDVDSIGSGDGATNSTTEGWAYLLGRGHAKTYPGAVQIEGFGYRAGYTVWNTAELRQAWAEKIAAMCVGYSTCELLETLGTNDYGVPGLSAANFATYGADALDRLHALVPGLTVWWLKILLRNVAGAGDEITTNASGDLPSGYRTAVDTIATGRDYVHVLDGPSILAWNSTNFTGIHPKTAGHATLAAELKTAMGF